ncbi:cytochrome P450 [Nitrobacter sp.]|uniref:cytochrome P450 n=1 Tax=Nitrobacter sp. TaxID=29420 RepID=UPI0029CAAC98|nr:cytochrome P450 [Nitrobacter sp.]
MPDHQNLDEPAFLPLVLDPPIHRDYRQLVAPFFMPKAIAGLESRAVAIADELIAAIRARGECEFITDFAARMPVAIFLQLLDIPPRDRLELLDIAGAIIKPETGEHRGSPLDRLFAYVRPIIEARQAEGGTDVISQLITKSVAGRPLTFDEKVKLTATLLLGGLDTVSSSLTFMTAHLARDLALRRRLLNDPSLIPAAVEESLRRFPVASPGRIVRRRATVRGVTFEPGDHVVWPNAMYNLDDHLHANPMRFDVDRKRLPHAGFGVGVHFCIGAFLARMEMRIFLARWLARIPDFSIRPGHDLRYRVGITIALGELPLVIP